MVSLFNLSYVNFCLNRYCQKMPKQIFMYFNCCYFIPNPYPFPFRQRRKIFKHSFFITYSWNLIGSFSQLCISSILLLFPIVSTDVKKSATSAGAVSPVAIFLSHLLYWVDAINPRYPLNKMEEPKISIK